jgi:hypothetical protein
VVRKGLSHVLLDILALVRRLQYPAQLDIYPNLVKYPVAPAWRAKQATMVGRPVPPVLLAIIARVELLLGPVRQELHRLRDPSRVQYVRLVTIVRVVRLKLPVL